MGFLDKAKKKGPEEDGAESASARNLGQSFTEHAMDAKQLATAFPRSNIAIDQPANSKGLSTSDAQVRLELDGPNALAPPKEISNLMLFLKQFLNAFWILQVGAGLLSIITYFINTSETRNLYLAILLFGVVIIMCVLQFFEEKKALAVIRGFSGLLPAKCTVIRNGETVNIDAHEIVVGDIVCVKTGIRVPADLRIIQCSDLKLEASSITGESEPVEYTAEPVPESVSVFESCNVAFNGSFCVDGEGIGIVIRTGERTIIGQIASLTTDQSNSQSTLDIEVHRFVKIVAVAALGLGIFVFIIGLAMVGFAKDQVLPIFINGFLVAIVSTIPEGLPTTVSSELTIIAHRMAKKNVYMKKLDVVDAFGATTVVASDKTGTLTQNNMKVTDLWYDSRYLNGIPEISHKMMKTLTDAQKELPLNCLEYPLPDLLELMCMCNKATIEGGETRKPRPRGETVLSVLSGRRDTNMWKPSGKVHPMEHLEPPRKESVESVKEKVFLGSPSEVALLRYVDDVCDVNAIRDKYNIIFEIPFNSKRKYHVMIVREQASYAFASDMVEYTVMLKGAPEVVIRRCNTLANKDGGVPLDEDMMMEFQDAYDHFGNNGRRVIGFAKTKFTAPADIKFSSDDNNFPLEDLTFLGISAIMDPPRPDTAEAIRQCKEAGIKVFMVTGDHPSTATAIAREIGLIGEPEEVTQRGRSLSVVRREPSTHGKDWATVHGKDLPGLAESDWDDLLKKKYIVFARTTPEQKLMIVEHCQKRGEIVTVTGDGVNDAPALKRANIGVAMGITGSDVAKQAADIVLMDDKFASIIHGIEEGRLLFDNLRKSIAYTLTHCCACIFPMLLNFIGGVPAPMSALQMLSMDLGTDLPPAISLAYENAESNIMKYPPRKKTTRLVSFAMLSYSYLITPVIICIGSFAAYYYTFWKNGVNPHDLWRTSSSYFQSPVTGGNFTSSSGTQLTPDQQIDVAYQAAAACYITTVTSQAYHIWMCRTRKSSIFTHGFRNIATFLAVISMIVVLVLLVYVPGLREGMGSSPPPSEVWAFSFGVAAVLLLFNEGRKFFIRRSPYNRIVRLFKW
ncbi:hypothetical protein QR680_006270 [Steinernema hermaphroditum]|uniref:Cation-transporting P-type ATPase N-terminal domain-containing protein n=1 Tax=Steinernema hermaphroditum TaxID=289476 RepID=A0AA39HWA1_9BILA|nr:hypothetical protein QR680_006270 [Steinernema hermaphroditum]